MSGYDKMVDEVAEAIWLAEPERIGSRRRSGWEEESEKTHDHYRPLAVATLAEVLRTLETVTPEMDKAGHDTGRTDFDDDVSVIYLAALRASPLAPPK